MFHKDMFTILPESPKGMFVNGSDFVAQRILAVNGDIFLYSLLEPRHY